MKFKKLLFTGLLLLGLLSPVWAANSFLIKRIQFIGLNHFSRETVLSYLPVKVGDRLSLRGNQSTKIIESLYKTKFFDNIILERRGNTLIVKVKERPTIGKIAIKGNKAIPTDKLKKALKSMGLREGNVFDKSLLPAVQSSLQEEYYSQGKYSARVDVTSTAQQRNRELININISEGVAAKIQGISIVGNQAVSDKVLLKQMKETTPTLFSFFNSNDQYAKEKLDADLKRITDYYMNHGYIRIKILSTQVSITPDKKSVYINIHVKEGPQYTFIGYRLIGKTILPREDLRALTKLKNNEIFSRKRIVNAQKDMTDAIADLGYAFAKVGIQPKIDDKKRTVFINFIFTPGIRAYVRRISFTGNTKTADSVLRTAMRQPEAGQFSLKQVKESTRQLKLRPYVKKAEMKTTPVPGINDQLDINYKIKEEPSAQIGFGIGLSDTDGILLNANFNQSNFLGTGQGMNINFQTSDYEKSYQMSYRNPFITTNGVSRTITFYTQQFDPGEIDITDYSTDQYGVSVRYGIPVTENNTMHAGYSLENTNLDIGSDPSVQLTDFVDDYGTNFTEAKLLSGWNYNALDQYIFPTQGFIQSVNGQFAVPANRHSLEYYKVSERSHLFLPVSENHRYVFSLRGEVGFGAGYGDTDGLPFYENYYAGGIGTVRGYEGNDLGPRDSGDDPIGGNLLIDGTASFIFPLPGVDNEDLRTSVFLDAGNVYNTSYGGDDYDGTLEETTPSFDTLNYSVGLGVTWRIPLLGPMQFSLAKTINAQQGAGAQPFNFNIGTSF